MKTTKSKQSLPFTGERMVPFHNKGKGLYYEHLTRYFFASQFCQKKSVLDLGCGSGYGSWLISKQGAKSVKGYDLSDEAVKYARHLFGSKQVWFATGDVTHLTAHQTYDVITAFEILEHLNNAQDFLHEIKRLLKNNGILCISSPNRLKSVSNNPFHAHEYEPREFASMLRKHFKHVYLFNQIFYFANSLTPRKYEETWKYEKIDEKFGLINGQLLGPQIEANQAMYLVAVCSDKPLRKIESSTLMSQTLDEFSLEDNIEGMTKAFITEMNQFKSSKTYRVWRWYHENRLISGCIDQFKRIVNRLRIIDETTN